MSSTSASASASAAASIVPEGPRHAVITADSQGAVLQIAAWFLMVVMILSVLLRLFIRFTTAHLPGTDDAVLCLAALCAIGEIIAISIGVNAGLGTRISHLTTQQISSVEKDIYAASILYIVTLALAKASTLLLIQRLANVKSHLLILRGITVAVLLWTVTAVFARAFQCDLPHPWNIAAGKCYNIVAFWGVMGTVDILLDLSLILLPALVVWDLNMVWQRKLVVVSAFAFRIFVPVAQILRLIYLSSELHSPDWTYPIAFSVATQCQTTLTVIVACIPALKPFMDRAANGMMGVSLTDRTGTYGIADSYALHSVNKGKGGGGGGNSRNGIGARAASAQARKSLRGDQSGHSAVVSGNRRESGASDDFIIQKTMDWDVQYSQEQTRDRRSAEEDNKGSSAWGTMLKYDAV